MCENLVELHSNQIFIGMVSMQYKAKIVIYKRRFFFKYLFCHFILKGSY
jgi:hypothetical protein